MGAVRLWMMAQAMLLLAAAAGAQGVLQPGDILLYDLTGNRLGSPPVAVASALGLGGAWFTHAAMLVPQDDGNLWTIEAWGGRTGVVTRTLQQSLHLNPNRTWPIKVVAFRLKPPYRAAIPEAIERARLVLGMPFDEAYLPDDNAFYCAELISFCYRDPATGESLFPMQPMTFTRPGETAVDPGWVEEFARKKLPLPVGELGLSPGALSCSDKLEPVYLYGQPTGWPADVLPDMTATPHKGAR